MIHSRYYHLSQEAKTLITNKSINLSKFISVAPPRDCGGEALFVGRVRDHHEDKRVKRLFYDCYESMAEKQIRKILNDVKAETGVSELRVIHRVGWLEVGEVAVAVSASSAHRKEAFDACRRVIDRIKDDVPIWKKEVYEDETQDWVVCQHKHTGRHHYENSTEASYRIF